MVLLWQENGSRTELMIFAFNVACVSFAEGWEDRWVRSEWKKSEGLNGKFVQTAGKWYGDGNDKGAVKESSSIFSPIFLPKHSILEHS